MGTALVTTADDVGGVGALLQGGIQLLSLGGDADGALEWQMHEADARCRREDLAYVCHEQT